MYVIDYTCLVLIDYAKPTSKVVIRICTPTSSSYDLHSLDPVTMEQLS